MFGTSEFVDTSYIWIPFGDHPSKLERYREDEHDPCARMTRTSREVIQVFFLAAPSSAHLPYLFQLPAHANRRW